MPRRAAAAAAPFTAGAEHPARGRQAPSRAAPPGVPTPVTAEEAAELAARMKLVELALHHSHTVVGDPATDRPASACGGAHVSSGGGHYWYAGGAGGHGARVGLSELYKVGKAIGEGAFGFVRVAQQRLSKELVAVKTFEKNRLRDASARRRLDNEIRVLQRVRHPHIVRLFETFESPKRIHLVMEYVSHGTLYRHLKKHKKLTEPEARRLFRQLVGALAYLHSRFISHRDIKLENVLLDHRRDVRLIDFGFAILSRSKLRVPCGSPSYTAPEIVAHKEYDGPVADVWSLGVLLYVLLAGRFPFQGTTRDDLSRNIMRGVFALPQHLSPPPDELLKRMLVTDAARRYNIENVRQHAWLARAPGEAEICAEHAAAPAADAALKSRLVAAIGFPADAVDASVAADRPDHVNTTYLLLKRQLERDAPGAGGDDVITEVEEMGVS